MARFEIKQWKELDKKQKDSAVKELNKIPGMNASLERLGASADPKVERNVFCLIDNGSPVSALVVDSKGNCLKIRGAVSKNMASNLAFARLMKSAGFKAESPVGFLLVHATRWGKGKGAEFLTEEARTGVGKKAAERIMHKAMRVSAEGKIEEIPNIIDLKKIQGKKRAFYFKWKGIIGLHKKIKPR